MSDADQDLTVAERLGQALDRGQLPAGGPAEAAERLIERLERPVRVAILGLQDSGKSSVLNILAGQDVIPVSLRLPTVLVQRGRPDQMVCTLPDGSTETVPGLDLSEIMDMSAALVTLQTDLPALTVISLLEVASGQTDAEQRRAVTWATKRADIVVWCTAAFLPKEQAVWEALPDVIKDNGFLLLTKSDLLGAKDVVTGVLDRLEQRAGDQFRQILPISALMARLAIQPDGSVTRAVFRASGASAVISAIKSRVDMARRADTDTAETLLARHTAPPKKTARRGTDPVPEIRPVASADPADNSAAPQVAAPRSYPTPSYPAAAFPTPAYAAPTARSPVRPMAPVDDRPAPGPHPVAAPVHKMPAPKAPPLLLVPKVDPPEPKLRPRIAARPASPPPIPPAALREMVSAADRAIVDAALGAMTASAAEIAARLTGADKIPVDFVLDHGRATTDRVAEILSHGTARGVRRIAADLHEVQDLFLLMQLEKGAAPAEDTLTVLLQIRRDLETLLAA